MTDTPLIDQRRSSESSEYVWDVAGAVESHRYLLEPVIGLLRRHDARLVLDLGCGNGAFSGALADEGFAVTGLDQSSSGIRAARSIGGPRFEQHDLNNPLPVRHRALYDAVIAVEVVEHLLRPRVLMGNALHALRPGGLLVLTTPYHGYLKNLLLALTDQFDAHWHPLRDFGHVKFFSRTTIRQLMQESGVNSIAIGSAGRLPWIAKSMIASGLKAA